MHKYPWWQDGQAIWKILVWPRDVCSKTAELGTGRSGKYVQLFIKATFQFNNWCSFSSKLVVNWSSLQPYKLWKSHLSPKPHLSPWFILPPPNRPTLYHCPAQRDFAQIFRHQQFCTTTRIPGRDLQKEHLTGRGGGITQANPQNSCHPSGLIWKCHRPARIHKHPLQGYLHSYKKTVYFFLNFLWTSYHWRLIFQLSMRCRKNTNTKLNIFLQHKTNVYQLSGVWKLKMYFETE